MDSVGRNDDVGFRRRTVGEQHPRLVLALLKAGGAMAGVHDAIRQRLRQQFDQIGAMHAEGRVPSGGSP